MSFKVPESKRITDGPFGSSAAEGCNGAFRLWIGITEFFIIASDGAGWEHVSVSAAKRVPTWAEMCAVKNMFWDEDDCVVQFHPPKSQYVNNHPHCLHLWRQCGKNQETPPIWTVGIK